MAKKIAKKLKLVIPAGKANPAPPIGPALGQAKVNIGEFVTRFNEGTKSMMGDIVPVLVTVYEDKTFDLTFKTPPAAGLILKAIGKEKGSGKNLTEKAGTISNCKANNPTASAIITLAPLLSEKIFIFERTA